ncbi:MAG: Ig-like domain-containing protein, partial [Planctomycetes bacterium]|nr:Ig-like domain-containing protein [Planctomycetota bacterium]
ASNGAAEDSETISITVANVNRPPVLAAINGQSVTVSHPLSFSLAGSDPDGDTLAYSAAPLPPGAAVTGASFAWTPTVTQTGTYTVSFTVSDGQLTASRTTAITVAAVLLDQLAPAVTGRSPTPDAIQVALNNVVTLHITDGRSGVDADSVVIQVNGQLVYQGNQAVYTSPTGRCSRTGTPQDYQFIYQSTQAFDFDQLVTVRVNAADEAGNAMTETAYSFTTEMRAFGRNQAVSQLGVYADSRPVTARDAAGNTWVAWHAGYTNNRDIYLARLPGGAETFEMPVRLTSDSGEQCNPALAVSPAGAVYVVWQDYRNGHWDLYGAIRPVDAGNFSAEVQLTNSNRHETEPTIAVDGQASPGIYVAWQDDRNGNPDIYVAKSTNGFDTLTVSRVTTNAAAQTEPVLTIDGGNSAYLFWTDLRDGQADLYGAHQALAANDWTNVPVVTGPGAQTQPAVAAAPDGTALHLVWTDDRSGQPDIYYAALTGLPTSPVAGTNLIDDSSGAEQSAPTVVCGRGGRVFAGWRDNRPAGAAGTDTDLYVAEIRSGQAGTNVFVGDDGLNVPQSEPALGLDRYEQPYLVWTDYRRSTTEIYYAATTLIDPEPLDDQVVVAADGATLGTDPAAITTVDDVSLVLPAGAYQADLRMTITRILNPRISSMALLGSYDFGPSGVTFEQPVTVTIPYTVAAGDRRVLPYWYDAVVGALSQQGITDIRNLTISDQLNALQFRTTHFTPFYLVEATPEGEPVEGSLSGGSAAGGCAIAAPGSGSPGQLAVPYVAIAAIMVILRVKDRRDRRRWQGTQP